VRKVIALSAVLLLSAQIACARDFRHLGFASTPTESDHGQVATSREAREAAPYTLTGRPDADTARPAPANLPTWVVGNPQFRPGK
jgi:hypothetical protein